MTELQKWLNTLSTPQVESIAKITKLKSVTRMDLKVRINGREVPFEADWLQGLLIAIEKEIT